MTESDAEVGREEVSGQRKRRPARGKRYSPALKKEILEYAEGNGVESAAGKYGVTETTIYDWRRAAKRRGNETGDLQPGGIEGGIGDVLRIISFLSFGPRCAKREHAKECQNRRPGGPSSHHRQGHRTEEDLQR
jgi:hypothetical protein